MRTCVCYSVVWEGEGYTFCGSLVDRVWSHGHCIHTQRMIPISSAHVFVKISNCDRMTRVCKTLQKWGQL